ncbi:hypothetical protein CU098_002946, partial [Rhizopus stolonifer]
MFNGRKKSIRKAESSREVVEEIDLDDVKHDYTKSSSSSYVSRKGNGSITNGSVSDMSEDKPALQRGLKARHLTMISLGGTIGTGLFLASGSSVASAGPAGALIAYALIGIMVFFMMECLGEMATFLPISGSFNNYAGRFIDPAVGFALGWNYWYNWAVTVAVELTAGSMVMAYWLPHVPNYVWSIVFLLIILALNLFSVKGY